MPARAPERRPRPRAGRHAPGVPVAGRSADDGGGARRGGAARSSPRAARAARDARRRKSTPSERGPIERRPPRGMRSRSAALRPGRAGAAAADPSPRHLRKAIDPIVARPEFAAAFWGIEVRSLDERPHALRPQRREGLPPRLQPEARDDGGRARRLRSRRAPPDDASRPRAASTGWAASSATSSWSGRGDPNLSARFTPGRPTAAFEAMADALVAAGVRRIEGRVVGHEGAFAGDRRGSDWTWEDLAWGYGTEVSALSFADNLVEVTLKPGERVGDPARLEAVPDAGCLAVSSSVTTARRAGRRVGRAGRRRRDRLARAGAGLERRPAHRPAAPRRRAGTAGSRCATRRRCAAGGVRRRARGEGHPRDGRRRHVERCRCPPAPASSPRTRACRWRR